jgi:hypothetical protein
MSPISKVIQQALRDSVMDLTITEPLQKVLTAPVVMNTLQKTLTAPVVMNTAEDMVMKAFLRAITEFSRVTLKRAKSYIYVGLGVGLGVAFLRESGGGGISMV